MLRQVLLLAGGLALTACAARSAPTDTELYAVSARELGMQCDAEFRETLREPTRSSVRLAHGPTECPTNELQLLTMRVLVGLASSRGFEYCVDLTGEVPAADDSFSWITERTHVVGFLDDPETDLARAFPAHFSPHKSYVVLPVDPANIPRALRASRRWSSTRPRAESTAARAAADA